MTGTLINTVSIVLAALAASTGWPAWSAKAQRRVQVLLGGATLGLGFHVIWLGLGGSPGQVMRQLGVLTLSLILGRLTGRACGLQAGFNRLGRFAGARLTGEPPAGAWPRGDVFSAAAVLFCLTPLALVGPLQEALRGDSRTLLIKSAVDALATLAWVRTRGWEVAMVAVPVLAMQGTVFLVLAGLRPHLELWGGADVLYATSGFLLLAVALVMLQILRVRLADYLPSLLWAALLAGWLL